MYRPLDKTGALGKLQIFVKSKIYALVGILSDFHPKTTPPPKSGLPCPGVPEFLLLWGGAQLRGNFFRPF